MSGMRTVKHHAPSSPAARDDRPTATTGRDQDTFDVPVGTEFDVRLQTALNSATTQVEDRFEATTMVDLMRGNRVVVPAGCDPDVVVSASPPHAAAREKETAARIPSQSCRYFFAASAVIVLGRTRIINGAAACMVVEFDSTCATT